MIGTITPLVKVARRQWFWESLLFTSASVVAGSALGLLLGATSAVVWAHAPSYLSDWARPALFASMVGLGAARELGWLRVGLPERRRSVPRSWWRFLDHRIAMPMYGGVLGLGVTTHAGFATFPVLVGWVLLYATPLSGLLVLGAYGGARALTVVATAWPAAHAERNWDPVDWIERHLLAHTRTLARINGWGLVLLLVYWML